MAQRRMFSQKIIGSDAFLEMPVSARELYFQLGMYADDDGFLDSTKRTMALTGASDDDLKILLTKHFVLAFEKGILVIKHWRINNFIRKDRYSETPYLELKKLLNVKENGAYTLDAEQGEPINRVPWKSDEEKRWSTNGQPMVNAGKVRLGKEREEIKSLSFQNKKNPTFHGNQMRKTQGKWWVIPPDGGEWLEFAGKESEIIWK